VVHDQAVGPAPAAHGQDPLGQQGYQATLAVGDQVHDRLGIPVADHLDHHGQSLGGQDQVAPVGGTEQRVGGLAEGPIQVKETGRLADAHFKT
jgi:hypothetical protein